MGWLDAVLGRTRLPKARPEGLFALTTAQLALKTELGWEPAGLRPSASNPSPPAPSASWMRS